MKKVVGAAIASCLLIGTLLPGASAAGPERMLTIVTAADIETQGMALVLSNQALAAGAGLRVLLCGPAGDLALKAAPAAATEAITPKGMSVRDLLEAAMAKGAAVEVCAIYLPNRSLNAEALMDGVTVAKPPAIAAEMLDPSVRLATF